MGVNLLHLGGILAAFFPPLACQGRTKKSSSVLNYFGGFISDQVIRWKRDSAASVRNWQFLLSFSLTDGLVWGGAETNSERKKAPKKSASVAETNQPLFGSFFSLKSQLFTSSVSWIAVIEWFARFKLNWEDVVRVQLVPILFSSRCWSDL